MENVIVPQIGEAVSELMIAEWFKAVGDPVEKGEPLFSVDSDKAVVEVEAVISGTLTEIVSEEGASVMPGDVVARVATEGTDARAPAASGSQAGSKQAAGLTRDAQTQAGTTRTGGGQADGGAAPPVAGKTRPSPAGGFVAASPRARKRAKNAGVDLGSAAGVGSGPRGMVVVRDLEGVASRVSSLRDQIARRTVRSKQTVPHFYLSAEVDMSRLMTARGKKGLGVTAAVVKAAGLALDMVPEANIVYDKGPESGAGTAVGLVVAVEDGLLIPVIPEVAKGTSEEIQASVVDAAAQARSGRISSRFQGPKTVTVSNLGMHDVDFFLPIIDTPGSMILGVGATRDRVVVIDGAMAIRPVCVLALAADHRAMDGITAGKYLGTVKALLEDPTKLGLG